MDVPPTPLGMPVGRARMAPLPEGTPTRGGITMTHETGAGSLAGRAGARAADVGGAVLAGATRLMATVRPAAKPLHPDGEVLTGRLERFGLVAGTGVPWLDEPGEDRVLVRLSRAIGLPALLPDIHGLAMRVSSGEDTGDLLLATTGWSRIGRRVLLPSRTATSCPLTTLLPYRTTQGPVVIGALASSGRQYELSWAPYSGDWQVFATLVLGARADDKLSFDPVRNRLPGLDHYPAVISLRERAYLRARQSRAS